MAEREDTIRDREVTDGRYTIREYAPQDDEACKRLEVVASQFQAFRGLVKSAIVHYGPFDQKAAQFGQRLVLVCADGEHGDAVVGVIAVAIKRARLHGSLRTVGYVFDLRVDEAHQRRGIALRLSREAEARISLPPFKVEYCYLSVNADNVKAKALYRSLGWSACSGRRLSFALLSQPSDPSARAALPAVSRVHDAARAAQLTGDAYARADLSLEAEELRALFCSELCLGTFVCADGAGSSAALSLWHGSHFSGFRPIRLLVPFGWWERSARALAAVAAAAAAAAVGALAHGALVRVHSAPIVAALLAAAALAGSYGALRAARFVRWARSRTHLRARAFGAVHAGAAWEPLMRAVQAAAHDEARRLGFAVLVMNTDQHDPVNRALVPQRRPLFGTAARGVAPEAAGGAAGDSEPMAENLLVRPAEGLVPGARKPPTEFWHKSLSPELLRGGGELPCLGPDAFFDPRDF